MTIANRCPYCGSTDIVIDVGDTIGCHLENLEGAVFDGIKVFCNHCGGYFDVEHVDKMASGSIQKTNKKKYGFSRSMIIVSL